MEVDRFVGGKYGDLGGRAQCDPCGSLQEYVFTCERGALRIADARRLAAKRITPHTFRHTAAIRLLESGVDVAVVKDWLGHASLDGTYIYARANLETKRRALELKTPGGKRKRWKQNPDLMAWLDSL